MGKTKRMKGSRLLAFMLAIITALSLCNVTEAKAAAEFTKEDFYHTTGSDDEGYNFIDRGKLPCDYSAIFEGGSEIVLTNKNIKLGDSLSKVQKAYGVTKKLKLDKTEEIYATMYINYPTRCLEKEWKYYLQYSCQDEEDGRYHFMNFYFDSKDKLKCIIVYGDRVNPVYTNKLYKSGYKFIAPKGKKVTTKTIGGKKVYLLPKGTKIKFNSKENYPIMADIEMYSNELYGQYNKQIAFTYIGKNTFKNKKTYKASDLVKKLMACEYEYSEPELVNYKKLGDYKYFVMKLRPQDSKDFEQLIPELVYFKFV